MGKLSGAVFSRNGHYRYVLWRIWDPNYEPCMFVGLNPSVADAQADDPTIRRCRGFAIDAGYGGLYMLNLFAAVSTRPERLRSLADPVGPANDRYLRIYGKRSALICAAWGSNPIASDERIAAAMRQMPPLFCLGLTKNGSPRHPLYLSRDAHFIPFNTVAG